VLWRLSVSYWVPSRSCETSLEHAIDRINVAPIFECFDRDTHAQIEWRDQSARMVVTARRAQACSGKVVKVDRGLAG
jgi:hypothetical protein